MARIELNQIAHTYDIDVPNPTYALEEFSITWEDGGRYAILGPSGCGKTTMLNIMSGIVHPTQGRILFDGVDVTATDTSNRNIAQVFQFPVIYNTMTVQENLAFPLVCRGVSSSRIKEKVNEVAETLGLTNLLRKLALKLTADQKQLISLGRGLVRDDVAAVLMDEPLTVIDPDLKFRLRRKLKEINEKYKLTLIYVTHDQNEAMTFAEQIVVMDKGKIVQVGTPRDLFEKPETTFVGYFIGSPAMNLFSCEVASEDEVLFCGTKFKTSSDLRSVAQSAEVQMGIRSEFIQVASEKSDNTIPAVVKMIDDCGNFKLISAQCDRFEVKVKVNRQMSISQENLLLKFPAEKCCVYHGEKLV